MLQGGRSYVILEFNLVIMQNDKRLISYVARIHLCGGGHISIRTSRLRIFLDPFEIRILPINQFVCC